MKRLVASMFAMAIAICFSVSIGCTPTDKKAAAGMEDKATAAGKATAGGDDKKFGADKTEGSLTMKDEELVITIKNGKVKSVEPTDDKTVSATKTDDKVTFKQLVNSPEKDATVEFTIKGEKDMEVAKVKVTVKAAKAK